MNSVLNKRLLLVDDEELNLFIGKQFLSNTYDVDVAKTGYDALDMIEMNHYDLILLDINLGDERMDGIRVMRTIKALPKYRKTKIIAVTAHSDARDWYMHEGFDELFLKPLAREGMLDLLERVQEIPRAQHAVYVQQVA